MLVLLGILFPLLPRPDAPATEDRAAATGAGHDRGAAEAAAAPPPKPEEKPEDRSRRWRRSPCRRRSTASSRRARRPRSSSNQFKDELADLREQSWIVTPVETKNLTGAVGADSHAERSLITSKVGAGSGGITSANSSRGFGSGAGLAHRHNTTTAVTSAIAHGGVNDRAPTRDRDRAARPAPSAEEIELVFDQNKGRIYSLYARALRDNPDAAGQAGAGIHHRPERRRHHVPRASPASCTTRSSSRRSSRMVRLFHFDAEDVEHDHHHQAHRFLPGV